ncbi:Low-molecular weight cobalt-containing nitrile hydratase subunit beta [Acaryochloris thomasi RCC1774]|uniref:nitrile hydratase n=1 Tax=Acaryochloris thomasi RCC1774 TaxID=1764569 RepID=A0A2W1JTI4_9CYAN|nr:nitrile hydratase subunit beta [Acaryochloris thomasi]PZD73882.1 Low-molecular weight cobalt-containing nitrile hydratase subunit beta [Acaryochloris thomasi RCC1774]
MKLQHNLGGLEGLDPITPELEVFVEPWEKRIFGIHTAMMALSNHLNSSRPDYKIDQVPTQFKSFWTWGHLRMGAEGIHPFEYFRLRYYEKWLGGISGFFVEEGYITQEELDARTAEILADSAKAEAPLPSGGDAAIDTQVEKYLREGDSPMRSQPAPPKFSVGDKVRIKNVAPGEHSRLPGNLKGHTAEVVKVYEGAFTYFFPTADGIGTPMPVYSLVFHAEDLWDESVTEPNVVYYNDIFEAYVEAA